MFIATGTHFQDFAYQEYKVTGHWSPESREGKTMVEMKVTYRAKFARNIELKGVFDPGENSLRGIAVMPLDGLTGEFVFKRDPNFVRFYPAPSVIDARARWKFVATAVLDRVRQSGWSLKRILKRIEDGKRFRELSLKAHCGGRFTREERWGLITLLRRFDEADIQFHSSLVNVSLSKIIVFA